MFRLDLLGVRVMLRSPGKLRRAFLRNSLCGHYLKTHFSRLCAKPFSSPIPEAAFLLLKYRRVVLLPAGDHMVNNAREFVCDRGNRFGRTEAAFHATEVVPEEGLV